MSRGHCRNQGESKGKLEMEIFEQKENSEGQRAKMCLPFYLLSFYYVAF